MKTPDILLPALRQYQHNDCSGLLAGFDHDETVKLVKLMQKELKAQSAAAWKPIETAPHDGLTWIYAYESDTGETGQLIFGSNPEEANPDEHADVWTDGYRIWNPSHWMHLPLPPTGSGALGRITARMRITPKQLEFLLTLHDDKEGREPYWECFEHEMRSALALHRKGMVEFEGGEMPEKGCEYFMARMTKKGWSWINALGDIYG